MLCCPLAIAAKKASGDVDPVCPDWLERFIIFSPPAFPNNDANRPPGLAMPIGASALTVPPFVPKVDAAARYPDSDGFIDMKKSVVAVGINI